MKCIIAGSRTIVTLSAVEEAIRASGWWDEITEVVSGGTRGVDSLGECWARRNNRAVKVFPAEWNKYGKAAGAIRNAEMGMYADALIAVWDGQSRGTKDMIERAKLQELRVVVHRVELSK